MAKAKITKNGNTQVTMSEDQWAAIVALLDHVRLGQTSEPESVISNLLIELCEFNDMYTHSEFQVSVIKGFMTEKQKTLHEDFAIVIS